MDNPPAALFPVNGGVDPTTGDIVLIFASSNGSQTRLQIPFDMSVATSEIVNRAAKTAAEHPKNALPTDTHEWATNLRAYEAREILFGKDSHSDKQLITIRTTDDLQISLIIDLKIIEELGFSRLARQPLGALKGLYASVAEDIDQLQRVWATTFIPPTDVDLRWGVAALRRLLINGLFRASVAGNGV